MIDCRPHVQHSIVHFVEQPNIVHVPLEILTKSSAEEIKALCKIEDSSEPGRAF